MAIIEQYGIRMTDRVQISTGADGYRAYFDGQFIGGPYAMGHMAVRAAQQWLKERQEEREAQAKLDARTAEQRQREDDTDFLYQLGDMLGCGIEPLERLIEIANRRKGGST